MSNQIKSNNLLMQVYQARKAVKQAQIEFNKAKKRAHEFLRKVENEEGGLRFYQFQIGDELLKVEEELDYYHPDGEWLLFVPFKKPNDLTDDFNNYFGGVENEQ